MRYALLIFVGVFVALFTVLIVPPGYAQEPTETPVSNTVTITAPPPYQPQINATMPSDFACPAGTPQGLGTVTPSSSWLMFCGDCLTTPLPTSTMYPTSIPYLTATHDGTGTPYPTSTVTPALSPTVTVTTTAGMGYSLRCGGDIGGTCLQIRDDTIGGTFTYQSNSNPYNFEGGLASLFVKGNPNLVKGSNLYVTFVLSDFWMQSYYGVTRTAYFRNATSGGGILETLATMSLPGNGYIEFSQEGIKNYVVFVGTANVVSGMKIFNMINRSGSLGTYTGSGTFTVYVSTGGYYIFLPTPTPTPTAVPDTGYCSVVSDMDMTGFTWTGISMTEKACFDIGPYGGFDWFGLTANPIFGYPWLAHICVQGVNIGELTVFGVTVSLHIMAYIVGFALFIRNMFIS